RSVDEVQVMKGYLSRRQNHTHGAGFIGRPLQRKTRRQHITALPDAGMRKPFMVRTGNHLHASVFNRALSQRDPCGHQFGRAYAPIVPVLMPGYAGAIVWILSKNRAGVHQDVRPYDPLDYVKNARVRGKLVSPAEMQMALP